MTFGLLGYPISNSFSRGYFTKKFTEMGISDTHQYLNFEMEDATGFSELKTKHPDLLGVNVTIPHKQAVMPMLDKLDPAAARIGAVNCIRFDEKGKSTGFNTDYLGFKEDLLDHLQKTNWTERAFGLPTNEDLLETFLEASNALILGTGGAALAVQEALRDLDVEFQSVSRSSGEGKITYADITPQVLADHLIVINTTPLGMAHHADTFPELPYGAFSAAHFCYDLVYNPDETTFLRKAREQGAGTGNGLGMLHRQAEAGWDIWMDLVD